MLSFKNFLFQTLNEAFSPKTIWTEHGQPILDRLKNEVPDNFRHRPETEHHEIGKKLIGDFVNSADPTPNKKFGNWISQTYAAGREKGGIGHIEDTGQIHDLLSSFHKKTEHVRNMGLPLDINQYKSLGALRDTVSKLPLSRREREERVAGSGILATSGAKTNKYLKIREGIEKLTDDKNTYLFPKTKEEAIAAAFHPDGSERATWCVSNPSEEHNRFDHYNGNGDLEHKFVIVQPHTGHAGEMYAWHPDSGEFPDRNNDPAPQKFHEIMSTSKIMQDHLKKVFLGK